MAQKGGCEDRCEVKYKYIVVRSAARNVEALLYAAAAAQESHESYLLSILLKLPSEVDVVRLRGPRSSRWTRRWVAASTVGDSPDRRPE